MFLKISYTSLQTIYSTQKIILHYTLDYAGINLNNKVFHESEVLLTHFLEEMSFH